MDHSEHPNHAEREVLSPEEEEARRRYAAAMHGCQSAVAFLIAQGDSSATAKYLRVGLSGCLVDMSAIALLLIEKGAFTRLEYFKALARAAEQEKSRLTEDARRRSGMSNLSFG